MFGDVGATRGDARALDGGVAGGSKGGLNYRVHGGEGEAARLRLVDVSKSFGAVRALRGVSMEVRAGEVHALLGENGAGKSTLIRVMAGVHAPDSGRIEVGGRVHGRLTVGTARAEGIAVVHQQPAMFPDLTVAENLALRLEQAGPWSRWRRDRHERRARECLARLGSGIDPGRLAGSLSMPEQQLVELAVAVGAGARWIVLDEPTASLTRREQERLYPVIDGLRGDGAGIVHITHRLEEVGRLADRVTVLRDGESVGTFGGRELDEGGLIERIAGRRVEGVHPGGGATRGPLRLDVHGVARAASGLKPCSLRVHAGEVVGLAGLVGSGRTELARVIFGLDRPDSGRVWVDGSEVTGTCMAMERGMAMVPEDRRRHGVVPEMGVAANLAMASHGRLFPWGWLRPGRERRVASEWTGRLGIKAGPAGSLVGTLSGGNQQKVALGRWLATRPKVLVLDEPTQGVDVGAKAEIHRWIREWTGEGMAVLMITSDLPELLGMSDRVVVMREGRVAGELPGGCSASEVMGMAMGTAGSEVGG